MAWDVSSLFFALFIYLLFYFFCCVNRSWYWCTLLLDFEGFNWRMKNENHSEKMVWRYSKFEQSGENCCTQPHRNHWSYQLYYIPYLHSSIIDIIIIRRTTSIPTWFHPTPHSQITEFSHTHIHHHHPTMSSSDDEDWECPLCMEEIDLTDRNFKPCHCGYQVCNPFCHSLSLQLQVKGSRLTHTIVTPFL